MQKTLWQRLGFVVVSVATAHLAVGVGADSHTAQDQLLALSIRIDARFPSYTVRHLDEITLFADESIRVVVSVGNHSRRSLDVSKPGTNWTNSLRIELHPLDSSTSAPPVPSAIRQTRPAAARRSGLKASERVTDEFLIAHSDGRRLQQGRYRLVVTLDEKELSPQASRLRNLLRRELVVQIKQAQTNEERVEHLLQLAYEARKEGQQTQERRWLEQIFTMNPDSITGLNDLGSSFLTDGDCKRARPLLTRAAMLLETGGDPMLQLSEISRSDLASNIRQQIVAKCS